MMHSLNVFHIQILTIRPECQLILLKLVHRDDIPSIIKSFAIGREWELEDDVETPC